MSTTGDPVSSRIFRQEQPAVTWVVPLGADETDPILTAFDEHGAHLLGFLMVIDQREGRAFLTMDRPRQGIVTIIS